MIQANELRIGNWVRHQDYWSYRQSNDFKEFDFIWNESDWYAVCECTLDLDIIEPIPLSEEWLVKFGGVSNPYQDRYEFGDIHVEIDKTKGITEIWIEDAPHIKNVHQFQNYVHAKTGEKL
jgi:hypothetical protein